LQPAMAPKAVAKRPAAVAKRPAAKVAKKPAAAKSAKKGGVTKGKKVATAPKATGIANQIAKTSQTPVAKKAAKTVAKKAEEAPLVPPTLPGLLLGMERRPDRRERCEDMLKKEVPWLQVQTEFFRATDGKADVIPDNEVAKTWNTKHNSLYGAYEDVADKDGNVLHTAAEFADPGVDYKFSPGERGCAHSHYRMWQRAAASAGPILILEDDVQFVFERNSGGMMTGDAWTRRLVLGLEEAAKKDIDVLYLGWSGHRDGNYKHLKGARGKKKSPILRKAEYVWTTVAYVLWPQGAKKLLEAAQPMDQPVDNFMGWECREGRLNSYVLLDDGDDDSTWSGGIVTQLDFTGDSDIKKSDGGDQGDDPTLYLAKKASSEAKAAEPDAEMEAGSEAKEAESDAEIEAGSEAKEAEADEETAAPATSQDAEMAVGSEAA